ncbi:ABC transporter permease [Streptantibioticus cattleyicolor]|uniref:ABC-2 type transporter n=1 Tax=Streptantibioticus cattleyicolor (strain ATCC 35852 / DSM 46488 / JCM 4925 / NBRC 14057 / NRRL 8057) TaxID=1003195 RepID=F8JL07_STREN|nr:ABC transporter permease [Streptantibioticus cattleyicolor]AEW99634.1 ABC-2 type transporter [Streptantibioticus cattleyicolor NRRL 8057 = DSM 46488]CCB71329.1 Putative drug resistance ABC transporter, permease subunit [Streptantibioticus cattleyicolor NRRL 8057 = DSM 46488]
MRGEECFIRASALVRHNTMLLLREPGPLVSRLVLPLGFVVLMRPLYVTAYGEASGRARVVTGGLVMFSLLALSVVGNAIFSERLWHTWNRLRASPARPLEVLVGKSVPVLGALACQQVVVLLFGVALLHLRVLSPATLCVTVLCWSLALLGLGAALGVVARSLAQMSAAYDIGGILLSALAGVMVPLSTMPGWVRPLAPISPGYWALRAFNGALDGDTSDTVAACAVLLAVAVAGAAVVYARLLGGAGRAAEL